MVNAAKHAPGQQVTVCLDYGDDDVRLSVVNRLNGAGASVRRPGSRDRIKPSDDVRGDRVYADLDHSFGDGDATRRQQWIGAG